MSSIRDTTSKNETTSETSVRPELHTYKTESSGQELKHFEVTQICTATTNRKIDTDYYKYFPL